MQHCASVRKKDFDEGCSVVSSSRGNKSSSISSSEPKFEFFNDIIRWFHQSQFFLSNICDDSFFNWQTREKKLFWTNKNVFSFFKYFQLKKKSSAKQIG